MNDVKPRKPAKSEPRVVEIVGAMALFLLVGIPIVLFDWRVLDDTLVGRFRPQAIAIAFVLALIFLVCAWIFGRRMRTLLGAQA